jgi:lipoprotein-anchoring transpeptidase ErfK/SrfK
MKHAISFVLLTLWLLGCDRAPSPPGGSAAEKPQAKAEDLPRPRPPAAPIENSADDLIARATALKSEGKLAEARGLLQSLTDKPDAPAKAIDLLGQINIQIVLSPTPAPEKLDHTIEAGDTLGKLAKKFGTTEDLIKQSNGLKGDLIRTGSRLRIYQGHFTVSVSKSANTLDLSDDGRLFKRYRVGTGEYSKTPVGQFKITSRIKDPPWWRPDGKTIPFGDPENILGTHWLGLDVPGYGIHGTWDTGSIGKQATAGCIRMLNDEVAELYTILPLGTPVSIRD